MTAEYIVDGRKWAWTRTGPGKNRLEKIDGPGLKKLDPALQAWPISLSSILTQIG